MACLHHAHAQAYGYIHTHRAAPHASPIIRAPAALTAQPHPPAHHHARVQQQRTRSSRRSTVLRAAAPQQQQQQSQQQPLNEGPAGSANGEASEQQQPQGEGAPPPQADAEGSWQQEASYEGNAYGEEAAEYYEGSDWGEPEPITDWGEAPWMRRPPDRFDRGWEPGYYGAGQNGYAGIPPPPPPPSAAGTSAPYSGSFYDSSSQYNGAAAGGPSAAGPGYAGSSYSGSSAGYTEGGEVDEEENRDRWESGGGASSSGSGSSRPFMSDITLLTRDEMEALMPVPPTRGQTNYYKPKSIQERLIQIASTIGVSLFLSKSAALAAPVLLYPIWSPWVKASCKNLEVYTKQMRCLGLWRAQVLEVQILGGSPFTAGSWAFGGRSARAAAPTVRVLIGDGWASGARVQLEFPYTYRSELLTPGEPVEALVLGSDATFSSFKVIREIYAPGLGLWLSDYPFIDKSIFLDVSLQIENERQADADAVDTEAVDLDSFSWNYQGDELPQDWQQQEDSNSGRLRNNDPQNVGAAGGAS